MKCLMFVLSLSIPVVSMAQTTTPTTPTPPSADASPSPLELKKGQPAPFSGVLFTDEDEQKLRIIYLNNDFLTQKDTLLEDQNATLQKQVTLWNGQATTNAQQLAEAQSDTFWKKAAFFALGMVATIGAGLALKAAAK